MTPQQENALKIIYCDMCLKRDSALDKYRASLRAAYRSRAFGITEKRKAYRSLEAQVKGLREKLRGKV
jgi:hypothetical protein